MARQPSPAARVRAISFLDALIANPEGIERLDIVRTHAGKEQVIAQFAIAELGEEAEAVFEEHLIDWAHEAGRIGYRLKVRDQAGVLVPGASCTWGLRRIAEDADGARTAGGGSELAAAQLSRVQGEGFKTAMGMIPALASQAAGTSADQLGAIMESHERALEDRTEAMFQQMELQGELIRVKTELALTQTASFWDSEGGTMVLGTVMQGVGAALPAIIEGWSLRNRRAELELERAELELEERRLEALERRRKLSQGASGPPVEDQAPTADA
jgi:hypothetical protein